MISEYPAIFYEEEDGGYSVVFPDLNHLATDGDDLNEAMEMAIDCLAGYLYTEKKDGNIIPPPTPSKLVNLYCEDDSEEDRKTKRFLQIISVNVEEYAKNHFEEEVKCTISIPKWLKNMAAAEKLDLSEVFKNALMKKLNVAGF